jgi:glutamate-1-semialdehyde aminotransferase
MNTKSWYDRSRQCIAQGALTNSKHPSTDVLGVFPTHFERGYGPYLYVDDSHRYLDFVAGLGAINLGYGNEQLETEVAKVQRNGGCISGNTQQEIITAEKVKSVFHWCDRVKFLNDGTEACMAAIRMARAFTGKKWVLWEGYHGWYDEATAWNSNAVGTPLGHYFLNLNEWLNNKESDPCVFDISDIAAIIVEPVMIDDSRERIDFLKRLREFCDSNNIILIFDEVVTGMRYPSLSVAKHWSIYPDLICLGKACANGYKIGMVAGRADILDSNYFVSGTYFGHIPTLKATEVCMHLSKHDSKYNVTDLNETALGMKDRFNLMEPDIIKMVGWGARMNFEGSWENIALFRQIMIEARIFTKTTFFMNHATKHHTEDFILVASYALQSIKHGTIKLKGSLPNKPVAQIARERS